MKKRSFTFSSTTVNYYFDADFSQIEKLAPKENAVIITDEHVFAKDIVKLKEIYLMFLKKYFGCL